MLLADKAIDSPRVVALVTALLCVVGFLGVSTLPKERQPRIRLPVIVCAVPNPGATPAVNEAEIVRKVEDLVSTDTLPGLRESGGVLAEAMQGAAVMVFVFNDGVDVVEAKRNVSDLINRVKGQFPARAQSDPGPIINDIAFEDWPIIQVFVAGGDDAAQRRRVSDRLKAAIQGIEGVSNVDSFGGEEREVQVEVDPHRMTLYGFAYDQVVSALRRGNLDSPSGSVEGTGGNDTRVRTEGRLQSLGAIAAVPLGVRQGQPLVIADVAQVRMGRKPLESIAKYGGEEAVVLLVRAKTDVDVLRAASAVQDTVDAFVAAGSQEQTRLGTVRSQARTIQYMLDQLGQDAMYGAFLVILPLVFWMGWRNSLMVGAAIPLSMLGAAAVAYLGKRTFLPDFAINNMTLLAAIVTSGMVVDGSIVVVENIYRHRELGKAPAVAAKDGMREIGASLMGVYLTTFASFAPLYLVRGVTGDFLSILPTVVFMTLGAAMVVDHYVMPVLSVWLMKVPEKDLSRLAAGDSSGMAPEQAEVAHAEKYLAASRVKRAYGRLLMWSLRRRHAILALTLLSCLAPPAMYAAGAFELEYFPDTDAPWIEVYYELPLGSSMEGRTAEVGARIEQAVLAAVREEEWHRPSDKAGRSRPVVTMGNPSALNISVHGQSSRGPEFGMVFVELELAQNRSRTAAQIKKAIEDAVPPMPGVVIRAELFKDGPPTGAPVAVRVMSRRSSGLPVEALAAKARDIERILLAVPGAKDITNDHRQRTELVVVPERVVAGLFDIDAAAITTSVGFALDGMKVGEVDFGGSERIDIRLRNLPGDRDDYDDLAHLPLRNAAGRVVTLDQVASIHRVETGNVLRHHDRQRVVHVRGESRDGASADDVKLALVRALRPDLDPAAQRALATDRRNKTLQSDDDFIIDFGGETEIRDDAMEDLIFASWVAVAIISILLVIQFNGFSQPLIILLGVPISLVGVAAGLHLFGFKLSVSAMIGVSALSGIVVDTGILMVEFYNILRRAGVPVEKALVYAGGLRLRPICLTVITTITALIPTAFNWAGGSEFFQPLTVAMMFGLGCATVIQLVVIPLCLYSFDPATRRDRDLSLLDEPAASPAAATAPGAFAAPVALPAGGALLAGVLPPSLPLAHEVRGAVGSLDPAGSLASPSAPAKPRLRPLSGLAAKGQAPKPPQPLKGAPPAPPRPPLGLIDFPDLPAPAPAPYGATPAGTVPSGAVNARGQRVLRNLARGASAAAGPDPRMPGRTTRPPSPAAAPPSHPPAPRAEDASAADAAASAALLRELSQDSGLIQHTLDELDDRPAGDRSPILPPLPAEPERPGSMHDTQPFDVFPEAPEVRRAAGPDEPRA